MTNGLSALNGTGVATQSADCLMTTLFLSFYVIQRPAGAHVIECHFFSSIAKNQK